MRGIAKGKGVAKREKRKRKRRVKLRKERDNKKWTSVWTRGESNEKDVNWHCTKKKKEMVIE